MFGVQEELGLAPDPVAHPVELHRGDAVDGLTLSLVADPVVALSRVEHPVIHKHPEHVRMDPLIRVTLGVCVPVGVEEDLRLVEGQHPRDAPALSFDHRGDQELWQRVHPGPVQFADPVAADGLRAVRVCPVPGQQGQFLEGGVGVAGASPFLLGHDQAGRRFGDRQAPFLPQSFEVVVDQLGFAVAVPLQAVPGQDTDLVRPPAGIDDQFGRGPGETEVVSSQGLEVIAELAHHLDREVAAGFIVLVVVRDVFFPQSERVR
ncbi:hypothetical protein [Streptomyces flavidovirens]